MQFDVVRFSNPISLAGAAADYVASVARERVDQAGIFRMAVSGGTTPGAMFDELAQRDLPWEHVVIYQVDERVAPDADTSRNATGLLAALGSHQPRFVLMDVTNGDLTVAAENYAAALPEQFDLVHLGLGDDGHTASLTRNAPHLHDPDRLVIVTDPFRGHRRMSLTFSALARTKQLLWLVSGNEKSDVLTKLLAGDQSIAAAHVQGPPSLVLTDCPLQPV
jgi:6-phosphogluconolactonase